MLIAIATIATLGYPAVTGDTPDTSDSLPMAPPGGLRLGAAEVAMPDKAPPTLSHRLALRPREAAEALGISERKFRGLLPQLPVVREGGVVMIPVNLLRQWLIEQATQDVCQVDVAVGEILGDLGSGD